MPKTKISEFSSTPANNTDIDSINIAEGCAPSGINDAIRELMSQLKDWQSGTSNDPMVIGSSGSLTLNQGTANGVAYLNGSKVVTSGSALTFNGTSLGIGSSSYGDAGTITASIGVAGTTAGGLQLWASSAQEHYIQWGDSTTGSATYAGAISYSHASDFMRFWTNSTEQMRLTSTGLGIGTSSPSSKLTVVGTVKSASATQSSFYLSNAAQTNGFLLGRSLSSDDAQNFFIYDTVAAATRLYLDSSGNLGLGVTPSAWGGSYKGFQVAATGVLASNGSNGTTLSHNAYYDGTNDKYLTTGAASRVFQFNGGIRFDLAASGTAGNAITFTQAMTLDASGNLGVGTTSPTTRLSITDSTGPIVRLVRTSNRFELSADTDFMSLNARDASTYITFKTADTERARINSSGKFLVNTTSTVASGDEIAGFIGTAGISAKATGGSTRFAGSFWNDATTGDNVFLRFYSDGGTERGSITYNRAGGLTVYNTTSDYRAKDIYGPVTGSGALIDSVPVYMGKMKGATQERPMFIAHETPEYAHTGVKDAVDADGNPVYQQMDASALIPVMWAEIQSLRKRLADAGL